LPGNETHDTETKLREYAQAGIAEYWIVEPTIRQVWVHTLEGGAYRLLARFAPDERARSIVLNGFEIAVNDLFPAE
jgi:Uma2 family endonuclease